MQDDDFRRCSGAVAELVRHWRSDGKAITDDIARLHVIADYARNSLGSVKHYADAWGTTYHYAREIFAGLGLRRASRAQETGEISPDSQELRKPRASRANAAQETREIQSESQELRKRRANESAYMYVSSNSNELEGARALGWPTIEQVRAAAVGRGGTEQQGESFFHYYEVRKWKLQSGEYLPDWNWILQLQVHINRERSKPNGSTNKQRTEPKPKRTATTGRASNRATNKQTPEDFAEQRRQHYARIFSNGEQEREDITSQSGDGRTSVDSGD